MGKATGDPKTRTLAIRLSEKDEAALRKLSRATDRSRGAVVRLLIRQAALELGSEGPKKPAHQK